MRAFIACSARDNVSNDYKNLASDVATVLARHDYKLIYGGADTGMMGKCLMTYKYEGKKVKGFVDIKDAEHAERLEFDAMDVLPNTFDRTRDLYKSADLIVILPGGIGTLAEFISCMEENLTRGDNKKMILFNYNHFYTPLLNFYTKLYDDKFVSNEALKSFIIVKTIEDLEKVI